MQEMFEIKRPDRTHICDCCGKKIEPKVARVIVHMPLGLNTRRLCYACANELFINFFMKEG